MRRCRGVISAVVVFLTAGLLIVSSKLAIDRGTRTVRDQSAEQLYSNSDSETANSPTIRYVTQSLAELGDRGDFSQPYDHVLMLTRVAGAGAELLVLLLQRLQGYNAFKHIRLPPGDEGILTTLQQELLVEEVTSIIRQEAIPLSFDGDVRFLNFSAYGRQPPTFISIVRDPLDSKVLDRFLQGDSSTIYRGLIAHFCGHHDRCTKRNNKWALEQAKANVEKWYPVVGILDHMKETLKVLEDTFPYFFEGASVLFQKLKPKRRKPDRQLATLKPESKKRLGELLRSEVEFYQWLKSRLLSKNSDNR